MKFCTCIVSKLKLVISPIVGVSQFKQAFSTGVGLKLLVRSRLCCCQSCLARDFSKCTLQVTFGPPMSQIRLLLFLWKLFVGVC